MSWLNFDSLNNIKGQLSNLASTVLADDKTEYSEASNEPDIGKKNEDSQDEFQAEDSWRWSTDESKTDQLKTDETITTLKKRIGQLKNENRELIGSLDQLDHNHQQNTEELVRMKTKLREELELVTEKYEILNMRYNKLAVMEQSYKKKINEMKCKYEEISHQKDSLALKNDNEILSRCKVLEQENSQLIEEIASLRAGNTKVILEETNPGIYDKSTDPEGGASDLAKKEEKTSQEILKEYEEKIKNLENELEILKTQEKIDTSIEKTNNMLEVDQVTMEQSSIESEDKMKLIKYSNEIKEYERKIQDLTEKLLEVQQEEGKKRINLVEMKKELQEQELKCTELLKNNTEMDKKYLQVMSNNFNKYLISEDVSEDCSFLKFCENIKVISDALQDFETRCNSLQTRNVELFQSKTDLQNEKNAEIKKLLQNNEIMSQQLLKKSEIVKELDEECSELRKNNDLLINKLEELRETGLQTIFESNEDNVVLLERHLESANERICELEKNLFDHDSTSERKIDDQIEKVYNVLQENVNGLQEDNKFLKNLISDFGKKLIEPEVETDGFIDGIRIGFETSERKFSEVNINLETLREAIEKHMLGTDCFSENEDGNFKIEQELKIREEEISSLTETNKYLRQTLEKLETKLANEIHNGSIEIEKLQNDVATSFSQKNSLEKELGDALHTLTKIQSKCEKCLNENKTLRNLYSELLEHLGIHNEDIIIDAAKILEHFRRLNDQVETFREKNNSLNSEIQNKLLNENDQKKIEDLEASRNELIAIVQTKHQETLTYHAEIQRLSELLKGENEKNISLENQLVELKRSNELLASRMGEIEKLTDQISFLKQKCGVLSQNLLEEQQKVENEKSSSLEKETALSKKLERLQSHLIEVEEYYSQELLQSEQKIAQFQARLNDVEQREKDSSTIYTSVSIRANQQNEALQQQLQSMTNQRDEFRKKTSELEDENNVKSAALSNLQLVLEQFQRDREADVIRETDRIRRQIKQEQNIQEDLKKDIASLEAQIKESKQGLHAASRLTDQLEMSKNQVYSLKEEVMVLTEKLHKKEEMLKTVTSQTDGKVDKSLVKNLIIGYVTSNRNVNKDQNQILKIIATVLDFNEQDHKKVNLNQAHQNNWLKYVLNPTVDDNLAPHESLSRAFVNFLENESKPKVIPSLLPTNSVNETSTSSNSSSSRTTPIVLNEIVLPTFTDFPQHRNSSSILKGVLKDNP